jgi:hypothetical protein
MFIQHITIENFGAICSYEIDLAQKLNLIDSRYADEISAAIRFLLCSELQPMLPKQWLHRETRISATIYLEDGIYSVCGKNQLGQLQLFATDPTGTDVTAQYQYALSHCEEQDDVDLFDGQDKESHLRLYRYYYREEYNDLSGRTRCISDTKTFRRYLCRYIQSFCPEPINCAKKYQATINAQGIFEVFYPGFGGGIHLSETEEKLFSYICFLNVAEFWTGFESIRDLHHKKKPLIIQNFVEFLDETANISKLIARTKKLHRQIIILTVPLDGEIKKKWIGEQNE